MYKFIFPQTSWGTYETIMDSYKMFLTETSGRCKVNNNIIELILITDSYDLHTTTLPYEAVSQTVHYLQALVGFRGEGVLASKTLVSG